MVDRHTCRHLISRTLKRVTFTVQNSKGSRSQISTKHIITIADEAEITASTNVLLIYIVEAKTVLYAMFVLEAIVPRACMFTARGLELKIWEQNYCLPTSGGTAHALSMANEMPSSNTSSQRSSFSRSAGQG